PPARRSWAYQFPIRRVGPQGDRLPGIPLGRGAPVAEPRRSRAPGEGRHPEILRMLKHGLIHPKINEVLGRAGHHGKVLIADGNYPASTAIGPTDELISLNLPPGIVNCTELPE